MANPYAPPTEPFAPPPVGGVPTGGNPADWEAGDVLGQAWEVFKRQWVTFFLGPLLAYFAAGIPARMITQLAMNTGADQEVVVALSFVGQVISWAIISYFNAGLIKASLSAVRGYTPSFGELFQGGPRFLPLFGTYFLMYLAISVGLIMLIVPGIIVALALSMAPFYCVDQNMGPVDAFKASWNVTEGQKGKLFVFALLSFLLMIVGILFCCIGMYGAVGVVALGNAIIFTRLTGTMGQGPTGGFGFGGFGPPGYGPPGYGPPGYGPPGYGPPGYGPPGGGFGPPPGGGGGFGPPPGGGGGFGPPPGGGYGPPGGGGYGPGQGGPSF
jgi:uncharacterized membrane protein